MDYRANVDGIRWFCDEIWPEVRRRQPQGHLHPGWQPPFPLVRRLAKRPGVRLACDVPDVRPYLAEAALVVVPLRIARGIQNKVLEALAMAKAVIATPEALEGIAVEPEVHACQALAPAQWIESMRAFAEQCACPGPSWPGRPNLRRNTPLLGPPIAAACRAAWAARRLMRRIAGRRPQNRMRRTLWPHVMADSRPVPSDPPISSVPPRRPHLFALAAVYALLVTYGCLVPLDFHPMPSNRVGKRVDEVLHQQTGISARDPTSS